MPGELTTEIKAEFTEAFQCFNSSYQGILLKMKIKEPPKKCQQIWLHQLNLKSIH